jgi:hypothetical protein
MFTSYGINLPDTNASQVIFLGAPLLADPHLDSVLERNCLELRRLSQPLELMPSYESRLYLLNNVLTAPRTMYLLRTAPCTDSPEQPLYDSVLRESLSTTLNIDLDDDRWSQAL